MSFQNDIDAAVKVFGVKDIGLIWGLGMMQWESDEDRDSFFQASKNNRE